MIHRGDIVHKRIKQFGVSYKHIYESIGIDEGTLREWLKFNDLEYENIALIGKALRHDFSIDFEEMRGKIYFDNNKVAILNESVVSYGNPTNAELKNEIMHLKAMIAAILNILTKNNH